MGLSDLIVPDGALGIVDEDAPARDPRAELAFLYYWPLFLGVVLTLIAADSTWLLRYLLRPLPSAAFQTLIRTAWGVIVLYGSARVMDRYAKVYGLGPQDYGLSIEHAGEYALRGLLAAVVLHFALDWILSGSVSATVGKWESCFSRFHWHGLGALAAFVAFPAAVEEVQSRGLIYSLLARRMSAGWAILVSAAVFALIHHDFLESFTAGYYGGDFSQALVAGEAFAMRFVVGLFLGWLRASTGTLVGPMAGHTVWNVLAWVER
jgi:membrane protease YdiL (CAAX protease family)